MLHMPNFESLVGGNLTYCDNFKSSDLMVLAQEKNSCFEKKDKLLDCIQLFSNHFQNTVMLKHVFTENPMFKKISHEHLNDEYNHNDKLMKDRNNKSPTWDPVIESCGSWFSWQMMILDNVEKITLMHLVLESSADIFFKEANVVFANENTDYFSLHCDLDEHHSEMGLNVLKDLREEEYTKCLDIQKKGWDVLISACNRIASIVNN